MPTEDATIETATETIEAPKPKKPRKLRDDKFGVTEAETSKELTEEVFEDAPAEPFVEPYDPTPEPNVEVIDDEVAKLHHQLDEMGRWREKVNEISRQVSDAQRDVERKSRSLKESRKIWEENVARLTEISGTPPPSDEDDAAKYPLLYPAKDDEPAAPTDAEAWRAEPLTVLGLTDRILEELHAANLVTVGQLADYTTPNSVGYCRALTDISGIGEAKAEKIDAAMMEFWKNRPAPAVVPFALETTTEATPE